MDLAYMFNLWDALYSNMNLNGLEHCRPEYNIQPVQSIVKNVKIKWP